MTLMSNTSLSNNLKALMEDHRVSSTALSKSTKIPKSTISTYLSGKKAAYSPDHLYSLSQFFSVTVDYLLYGVDSDFALLNTLKTQGLFEGWLKVKIERAVPSENIKRKKS